jgi:hypothetical protein
MAFKGSVLRDPTIPEGIGQFAVIQSVAPSLGMEVSPVDIRDAGEIERAVTAFTRSANGGLIVTSSGLANVHRDLIIGLAAKLRLPAVYSFRFFVSVGVICPLDILEARERSRGDRVIGRARGLVDVVHCFCGYDVVVDTGHAQVEACVAEILASLTSAAQGERRYRAARSWWRIQDRPVPFAAADPPGCAHFVSRLNSRS